MRGDVSRLDSLWYGADGHGLLEGELGSTLTFAGHCRVIAW